MSDRTTPRDAAIRPLSPDEIEELRHEIQNGAGWRADVANDLFARLLATLDAAREEKAEAVKFGTALMHGAHVAARSIPPATPTPATERVPDGLLRRLANRIHGNESHAGTSFDACPHEPCVDVRSALAAPQQAEGLDVLLSVIEKALNYRDADAALRTIAEYVTENHARAAYATTPAGEPE